METACVELGAERFDGRAGRGDVGAVIAMLGEARAVPLGPVARLQAADAGDHGLVGHVVGAPEGEVAEHGLGPRGAIDPAQREERLLLRRGRELAALHGEVERADADAITREVEPPRRDVVPREGELPADARERVGHAPACEGVEQDLRVAVPAERDALPRQLGAQGAGVEQLAVVDEDAAPLGVDHRLRALLAEALDGEPPMRERDGCRRRAPHAMPIRPAVADGVGHGHREASADGGGQRLVPQQRDTAHGPHPNAGGQAMPACETGEKERAVRRSA
ncbi:MAG: hypothetical protein QM820_58880 [Minicystis sp.]